MTDDLTRDLNELIPELDASTVLDGAARKRRRARRRATVVAGTLVVALFTPVVLGLGTVMRSTPQPASSPTVDPDVSETLSSEYAEYTLEDETGHPAEELMPWECQHVMHPSVQPRRIPAEGLPDGATRVWLCGELGANGDRPWYGPRTPLTNAAEVVAAVNALPAGSTAAEQCHGTSSRRYRMVLEYPDGSRIIDAHTGHCDSVGGTRTGAKELLEQFKAWFTTARAQETATTPELPCVLSLWNAQEQSYPLFPIFAPDVTRGVTCGRFMGGEARSVEPLPDDILAALRDAPWQWQEDHGETWIDHRGHIVVGNQHGELLMIFRTPEGKLWMPQHNFAFTPDPDLAARLKELFDQLGNGVVLASPCQNTAYSNDVDDGDIVAIHVCSNFPWARSELEAYTLPSGLARRVADAFHAQALPAEQHIPNSEELVLTGSPALLLVDSKGVGLLLFPGPDNTLTDPLRKRTWQVPDELRIPLEARGLVFS
ncbi:MAG: hypothetical protein Q4D96_09655 [Propionibacteriaceae bacterium]|nr:hypothetical protein [Propionibacteriaceae bacterium]